MWASLLFWELVGRLMHRGGRRSIPESEVGIISRTTLGSDATSILMLLVLSVMTLTSQGRFSRIECGTENAEELLLLLPFRLFSSPCEFPLPTNLDPLTWWGCFNEQLPRILTARRRPDSPIRGCCCCRWEAGRPWRRRRSAEEEKEA